MTESSTSRWDRVLGLACVVAIVVFVVISSIRIEKNVNGLKGGLERSELTITEMRNRLETMNARLQLQQADEIEALCVVGKGRFDANQSTCTFDDGRPSLKFTTLSRGQ